jgi:hypothetical protein
MDNGAQWSIFDLSFKVNFVFWKSNKVKELLQKQETEDR